MLIYRHIDTDDDDDYTDAVNMMRMDNDSAYNRNNAKQVESIRRMDNDSAYNDSIEILEEKVTLAQEPIMYTNKNDKIDVCPSCYNKMTDFLKRKLNLIEGHKQSIDARIYYFCDICCANIFVGNGPETKLQILLKMNSLQLDVDTLVASCKTSPWDESIYLLYSELLIGGMDAQLAQEICIKLFTNDSISTVTTSEITAENYVINELACNSNCSHKICDDEGRLDVSTIDENMVEHLISSEQEFRYRSTIQELYRHIRKEYKHLITEDIIQRYVMMAHGVLAPIKDSELVAYRYQISKFTHLPNIRAKGFFLKNNIMVDGLCNVGSIVPNMQLHNYNNDFNVDDMSTFYYWTQKATLANKTLVIFSGSIT